MPMLINGDNDINLMFDMINESPQLIGLELYITITPQLIVVDLYNGEDIQHANLDGYGGEELRKYNVKCIFECVICDVLNFFTDINFVVVNNKL
jgi:hypothetical protein